MQADQDDEQEAYQRMKADDADGRSLDESKYAGHCEDQKSQHGEQRDDASVECSELWFISARHRLG